MLFLRYVFFAVAFGFLGAAAAVVLYDIYLAFELDRILRRGERTDQTAQAGDTPALAPPAPRPKVRRAIRWTIAAKLVAVAAISSLTGASIVVVPDGEAGVRISQISGVRPGTLYPGIHFIFPLITRVQLFDIRERVFATAAAEGPHVKAEILTVEAREGLEIGLAVSVRYRIDPQRLDYVQANLPQPIDEEIVAPVVTSVFRELAPNYIVRDVFSVKREEFRQRAAQAITARLGGDAIIVKEVLLRKVQLPEEYARGLEGLLLKEQEDDRTVVDASIEQKRVKIAESQAEAAKIREVKRAEADAQARVIQAKAESDAMQYTLPLKQKQIEQSKLEAEARKAATIQNAEAEAAAHVKTAEANAQAKVIDSKAEAERNRVLAETQNILVVKNAEASAQAKIIDGKAEMEKRNLMADAEAHNIRVTSQAEAEQLQLEAAALKTNPLLVQYTVAQRLSDRVQIMMVPNDGKYFFTNDVMKSVSAVTDSPMRGGSK
ncbi:MAG: SPFH domain-containing protein [Candidatus Acidiferrales bacterium]